MESKVVEGLVCTTRPQFFSDLTIRISRMKGLKLNFLHMASDMSTLNVELHTKHRSYKQLFVEDSFCHFVQVRQVSSLLLNCKIECGVYFMDGPYAQAQGGSLFVFGEGATDADLEAFIVRTTK